MLPQLALKGQPSTHCTSLLAFQSSSKLLKKSALPSINSLVGSRFLNWLGHVARMPETTIQRKLLTSFVTHEQRVQANKFMRPLTSTLDLRRNGHFRRTYGHKAEEWLTWATQHPEFNRPGTFDEDPDTDSVLRDLLTMGLSCRSVSDSDDRPSWYTLAQDRILWNEVCLLADHECLGEERIVKRKKKANKNDAKDLAQDAEAAVWNLEPLDDPLD